MKRLLMVRESRTKPDVRTQFRDMMAHSVVGSVGHKVLDRALDKVWGRVRDRVDDVLVRVGGLR